MSIGMTAFLILAAGSFMGLSTTIVKGLNQNTELDGRLKRILYEIRHQSTYAMNVRYAGNVSLDGAASQVGEGYVRTMNYQNSTDLTSPTTPLMFFAREGFRSGSTPLAASKSTPQAMAVFFRAPTQTVPGAILIHHGRTDGGMDLTPADADEILDGVIRVRLYDPVVSASGVLESIRMAVTVRYFLTNHEVKTGWIPENPPQGAVDKTSNVVLNFLNNKRETARDAFEFPMGFYFFRPNAMVQ